MLQSIARFFYPSVFRELEKYKEWLSSSHSRNAATEKEKSELFREKTELQKILSTISLKSEGSLTTGIVYNVQGRPLVLTVQEDSQGGNWIDIKVFDPGKSVVEPCAFLYATRFSCRIFIHNLISGSQDQGIGSILMNQLIKYANRFNVIASEAGTRAHLKMDYLINSIEGEIRSIDFDHREKLKTFYGKHGFTVEIREDSREGYINRAV